MGKRSFFVIPDFLTNLIKRLKYNRQRELEVNALCHENIKKIIFQNKINLVSFNNCYD